MFNFFGILKRFIPPYKKYALLSMLFNFLSTIFSLFSFAAVIPVLQILFGITKSTAVYEAWTWDNSLPEIASALKNNAVYAIEQLLHQSGPILSLSYVGAFLVLMTALKTGTAYLGAHYIIPIRTGVVRDLRNSLFRKILELPIGYFSEERKGDIISRMTSDVSEVEASIMSSLEMVIKNPIMILIYLGAMFYMSWELSVFVLLLLPFSGWLVGRIGRSLKQKSKTGQEQTGDLLSQIEETLGGLRIIKAFNAEQKIGDRFNLLNDKIRKTFTRINRRYNLAHPVSEFIGTFVIAILLLFGGILIVGHNSVISAPEFIYYIIIFYSIIPVWHYPRRKRYC
jgi:ATP-binding cassette, subfamily B, bacterial MsbA